MPAKKVEKKIIVKEKVPEKKVVRKSSSKEEIINQLMQSNLALQDKTADMIHAMKELTKRMDTMVALFEEAASQIKSGTDEPLMKKLEELLDQNKTIAKGLILLEKYVRERASSMSGFRPGPPSPEPF
ncbi:MAG: hypothetical protein QW404_00815 [Candidatus Nanoarchaeia archaeon]